MVGPLCTRVFHARFLQDQRLRARPLLPKDTGNFHMPVNATVEIVCHLCGSGARSHQQNPGWFHFSLRLPGASFAIDACQPHTQYASKGNESCYYNNDAGECQIPEKKCKYHQGYKAQKHGFKAVRQRIFVGFEKTGRLGIKQV